MRKLGLLLLVLVLVVAFAIPAFAWTQDDGKGNKFMFGGTWMTDFGYWNKSKERMGTDSDLTQMMLNIPAHTKVWARLESGQVGAFWEIGLGTGAGVPSAADNSNISNRQVYGYYNFGNCQIMAGKADGWIWTGAMLPQQRLGANLLTVWAFGFGNYYDGRFTQMRFTQNISKQFSYAISLVSPQQVTDSATSKVSYAQIPTIAAKFNMDFGVVSLFPAAAWSQIKWDKMTSGYDDNVTAWFAALPVLVKAGGFAGRFQVGYGQNIGNMMNNTNSYQVYQRLSGSVKNTTALQGFVDLAYTVGPITPHLMFGFDKADNTDAWKTADSSNQRVWYGVSMNYMITPNFMITPEFSYFDFGKKPNTSGSPDIGKDWMGGLQFTFTF